MSADSTASRLPDPGRRAALFSVLPFIWCAFAAILLWGFTADDAFIVLRYAKNLATGRGLVFNATETVSALTSPGHVIVLALVATTGVPILVASKCIGVLALMGTGFLLCRFLSTTSEIRLYALWISLGSPLAAFWAVGGLETTLLMFLITWFCLLLRDCSTTQRSRGWFFLSLLAGVSFLVRHDSALFTFPCVMHCALRIGRSEGGRRWLSTSYLVLPGLVISAGWLAFSSVYFHDPLPTSYYTKTPSYQGMWPLYNSAYIIQFLVLTGMIPLLLYLRIVRAGSARLTSEDPAAPPMSGIHLGLAMTAIYALGMVTSHMMFAYRFLLPYLPIAAITFLPRKSTSRVRTSLAISIIGCLQIATLASLLYWSFNPGVIGEYRHVNLGQYSRFLNTLRSQSGLIEQHWASIGEEARPPIVFVYAAGQVGHALPHAHLVDGNLLSYRHQYRQENRPSGASMSADYVMALVGNRHGSIEQQLGGRLAQLERIGRTSVHFDGQEEHMDVYYNRTPQPLRLPRYIDGLEEDFPASNSMQ